MRDPEAAPAALGPRWYAAKTQPRKEALAQLHLSRQDFETFCPQILAPTRRRRQGRGKTVATPTAFFPGYVFVRIDLQRDPWRSINGTIGVSHLVQFGALPANVPAGLVEALQKSANDNGLLQFCDDLKPGDSVRLTGGSFDGRIAKVLRTESKDRVSVLLDLMSRELPALVSRSQIMRLV